MEKKKRILTIYAGSGKAYQSIPQIRIQGKWLEALGFSIGDKLEIACKENQLIITKQPKTENEK